jgi:hypothetical protein
VLFPGAHADVGGGYPARGNECGLSDGALQWMIDHLQQAGVSFCHDQVYPIKPDPHGVAHMPWLHSPWDYPGISLGPRKFPGSIDQHPSIAARMKAGLVLPEPGEMRIVYRPENLNGILRN